jgi:hypothetical protein
MIQIDPNNVGTETIKVTPTDSGASNSVSASEVMLNRLFVVLIHGSET